MITIIIEISKTKQFFFFNQSFSHSKSWKLVLYTSTAIIALAFFSSFMHSNDLKHSSATYTLMYNIRIIYLLESRQCHAVVRAYSERSIFATNE